MDLNFVKKKDKIRSFNVPENFPLKEVIFRASPQCNFKLPPPEEPSKSDRPKKSLATSKTLRGWPLVSFFFFFCTKLSLKGLQKRDKGEKSGDNESFNEENEGINEGKVG